MASTDLSRTSPEPATNLREWVRALRWRAWLTAIGLVGLIAWAFWPSMVELAEIWESDPQYSHGYLVPLFAVALLWLRRDYCNSTKMRRSWWGVAIVAAGCLIRLGGGYYYYFWLERFALLPIVAGLAMTLGGWAALRWSWPSIAFLIFMLPLPSGLAGALG